MNNNFAYVVNGRDRSLKVSLRMNICFLIIFITLSFSDSAIFSQHSYDVMNYWQENPTRYKYEQELKKNLKVKTTTVKKIEFDSDKNSIDTFLVYVENLDKRGNRIKLDCYDNDGIFVEFTTNKFDSLNREIESNYYIFKEARKQFILNQKTLYYYDSLNNVYLKQYFNEKGQNTGSTYFIYNHKNSIRIENTISLHNIFDNRITEYIYDNNDKLAYSIEYHTMWDSYQSKIKTVTDTVDFKKKDPKLYIIFTKKGNVQEWKDKRYNEYLFFKFEYDFDENVIKKTRFENNKLIYTLYYEYFPNGLIKSETYDDKEYSNTIYEYEFYK